MENPIGLDGIEFVEFTGDPTVLRDLFLRFGFKKIATHKTKKIELFGQNDINFLINNDSEGFASQFKKAHGPSICSTGFRVKSAGAAIKNAVQRGAKDAFNLKRDFDFPAMFGIGDSLIYFVDRYGKQNIYDEFFEYEAKDLHPSGKGFLVVDHLTNNVPVGEMQKWCDFYEKIFNFKEVRYFDIRGAQTGLISKVMKSPCGKIIIPINEPTDKKSQIQEYLNEYKGSGVQHLAFLTKDIIKSLESLRESKIEFLDAPPGTYYTMLKERLPNVKENMSTLQQMSILADGDEHGYLLQIFTKNLVGPIFIEIIQREKHDGFGEGNFQALFDAIERDQRARGVL